MAEASTSASTSTAGAAVGNLEPERPIAPWRRTTDVLPSAVPFSPPKGKATNYKGKEKAIEDNAAEIPVVETYRNLLGSTNGGAANPLRVIAHIDIDAAYAAMEMARLKVAPDVPLAVQQWNGLIAVNYPARAFGITRHETPAEAKKKCPHIQLVHVATYAHDDKEPGYYEASAVGPKTHKVSLDPYRRESLKILQVFGEYFPIVEKASIDESFIDATLPVRALLLSRHPSLATLPPGCDLDSPLPPPSSLGITVDWPSVGNVIPIAGVFGFVGPRDDELTWSDVALAAGAELVKECRGAVETRLGYTCTGGLARNKMLAKLCSGWKKPNDQTILRTAAVPGFLGPLKFQKIRNLGGKLGDSIAQAYEASTVSDLLTITLAEMQEKMGAESGLWVWEIVRGIDSSEVQPKTEVKSMLSSKNFKPTISTYGEVSHWMSILATELFVRLTSAREQSPGLWPKTITFSHRSANYVTKSHQIPFPYTSSLSAAYILKHGDKLFRLALNESATATLDPKTKIAPKSNIQLSFSGLERLEEGQKGIEGWFTRGGPAPSAAAAAAAGEKKELPRLFKPEVEKKPKKDPVKDFFKPREKEGDPPPKKKKRLSTSSTSTKSLKPTGAPADKAEIVILSDSDDDEPVLAVLNAEETGTFECERCGKELALSVKGEHNDFHVARDMMEGERQREMGPKFVQQGDKARKRSATPAVATAPAADGEGGKKKKAKKEDRGSITGFFRPK